MYIQSPFSYSIGVALIYVGLAFWVVECIADTELRKRPWLSMPMVVLALVSLLFFTKDVVLVKAPLASDAYVFHDGDLQEVEDMPWSEHYTDLRVWINNETDNDYRGIKLTIQPDQWNHTAKIVGENYGCYFNPTGEGRFIQMVSRAKGGHTTITEHWENTGAALEDQQGDKFEPLLSENGYRLDCDRLPAHTSVQIVFALGAIIPKLHAEMEDGAPAKAKPGQSWTAISEFDSTSGPDDFLDQPPTPSLVIIDGQYYIGPKKVLIERRKQRVSNTQ